MNIVFKSFLFLSLLTGLSACGASSSNKDNDDDEKGEKKTQTDVEYIPVQTQKNGPWHFINSRGEKIGTQEWYYQPCVTIDGLFSVWENDGYTVFQWDGKEAKPVESLRNLNQVGVYNEGLLPIIKMGERIKVVDRTGNVKFTLEPVNGKEILGCAGIVQEGMLIITNSDYKSGIIDKDGKVIVEPKYDAISDFNGGYALARSYNSPDYDYEQGVSYYIINLKGEAKKVEGKFGVTEGECDAVPEFTDGKALVTGYYDYRYDDGPDNFIIDTSGKVTNVKNSYVYFLENGNQIDYNYEKYTRLTNSKGETLIDLPSNAGYLSYGGNYFWLEKDNNMIIYSDNAKELASYPGYPVAFWPGGNFGLIIGKYVDSYYSGLEYKLLDASGKALDLPTFYGIGTSKQPFKDEEDMYMGCGYGIYRYDDINW